MLNIENFETKIDQAILRRGKDHFKSGQVVDLIKTGHDEWSAHVEDNASYSVEITIKNNQDVKACFCDCPSEDNICKHVVAVLLAIKEQLAIPPDKKGNNLSQQDAFKNLLPKISLKEYEEFIQHYAAKNKSFRTEFELYFANKEAGIEVESQYRDLVQRIIKKYSGTGFIDYNACNRMAQDLKELLMRGEAFLAANNFKDTFAFTKAVLRPIVQCYEFSDDSSGKLSERLYEVVHFIEEIASSDIAPIEIKAQLFAFLQTELEESIYFDYGDVGYELFEIFQSLAILLNEEKAFIHFIDSKLKALKKVEYSEYQEKFFKKSKIEFYQSSGNIEKAADLIIENMDIEEIRQNEVDKAIVQKDYEWAKKLINEGIKIAEKKRHAGTVSNWKKELLRVAKLEKDLPTIRKYTKYFAFSDGRFSKEYYNALKNTYSEQEWTKVIGNYIQEITENKSKGKDNETIDLASIYIQEKYWDKLFELVKKGSSLHTLTEYHPYLVKTYPKEMLELYLPHLEEFGAKASARPEYKELVQLMKKLIKDIPGSQEKIVALAKKLRDQFSVKPRRPAMLEELEKVLK